MDLQVPSHTSLLYKVKKKEKKKGSSHPMKLKEEKEGKNSSPAEKREIFSSDIKKFSSSLPPSQDMRGNQNICLEMAQSYSLISSEKCYTISSSASQKDKTLRR